MPYVPPRSACFRPDEYKNLGLFADRSQEREELIEREVSFHALVPDWLLEAHGYFLPPQLHFLAVD